MKHQQFIGIILGQLIFISIASVGVAMEEIGAKTDGFWDSSSTWTNSEVPGPADGAYIGSSYPSGSAANATVTLRQDQFVFGVTLGNLTNRGTLDLENSKLTAQVIQIGTNSGSGTIQRGSGYFSTSFFNVSGGNTFTFGTLDTSDHLYLTCQAAVTTVATSNVTSTVSITTGGVLTLGADMSLIWLQLEGNESILNMAGHALRVNSFQFGSLHGIGSDGDTSTLLNKGTLTANHLEVGEGCDLILSPGDSIDRSIGLWASSMTVHQTTGQFTGLTFNGTSEGSLHLTNTSKMNLEFGQSPFSHWIFRWRNPSSSSNWGDTLTSLIGAGKISISSSNGFSIADSDGYTYIYAVAQPADFDWRGGNPAGPTDWNLAANWNPGAPVPNGPGVTLSFGNQTAENNIVDLGSGKTVGNLIFVATTNTTIQGADCASLTMDNNDSISTIDVTGKHAITVPVIMNNDVQIAGIGKLTLSAGISGPYTLKVLGNLTTTSIEVDTLIIGEGASGNSTAAVPEPSTIVLLGIFAVGLLCSVWRRK